MSKVYFTAILWNLKKIFTQRRWGQIIVILAYLLILSLLFAFIFLMGFATFQFLYNFAEVSRPIVKYILLSTLAFTSVISIISFTFVLSQRLYEKRLAPYFLSGGGVKSLFQAIFLENFLLGGWPFIVLALPLLLANLVVRGANPLSYPLLCLLLVILILFTESLGAVITLFLRYSLGRFSQKSIYLLTALTLGVMAVFLKNVFLPNGLAEIAKRPTLQEVFAGLGGLPLSNPWLPTNLLIETLSLRLAPFLLFAGQAVLAYFVSLWLADKVYLRTWQKAQEGLFFAKSHQGFTKPRKPAGFRGVGLALFKKEFLQIDRSPGQLLYFGFIIFLAVVYFFLLSRSPRSPEFAPSIFPKTAALTVIVIGYLVTMIALRFSFPSLIADFRPFWVFIYLANARRRFILVKWLSYTFLPLFSAWILAVLAFLALRLSFDLLPVIISLSASGAIIICAINLFAGTFWAPQLPRGNIEQTTTALPAVVATLLSVFVGFLAGLLFFLLTTFAGGQISLRDGFNPAYILGTTLVLAGMFWFSSFYLAQKRFMRMDIS